MNQVWHTETHTDVQYSALHLWTRDTMWYWFQTWSHEIETACRGLCQVNHGGTVIREGPKEHLPCLTYKHPTPKPLPLHPAAPHPNDLLSLSSPHWWWWWGSGGGGGGVASQLTWRGSHRDKSQFTQGAVTLDDIFTGCLYSSFDNAPATSFISLKDESKAGNVISPLRQGRRRRRIKEEGGAS